MGVEIRTIQNSRFSVDSVADNITEWLMHDHNYSVKQKGLEGKKYVILVNKSGFLRQIAGLVFEYKIEIHMTSSHLIVSVDDGDIRKQLAALGVAWFIAWPTLATAGYGMFASGKFRQEILDKIEYLVTTS